MYVQNNTSNTGISSDGAWQGDNPLNHALPLLIIQTILVLFTSRLLAFILRPLRQPKVVAEIAGGILLGPSAMGRNKEFLHLIFPSWSTPILETIASFGLLFFLFLVGLELDLSSIRNSSRRVLGIALAGISLPFLLGAVVSFLLRKVVHDEDKVGYGQYLMFMGVALSITAFPVLARILAELKLLTTQVGQTAMAAAAVNDFAAWVLLALAVALAGNGPKHNPLITIWVLISGAAFLAVMLILVRPMMSWVARQCSPGHDYPDEAYICLTLAGAMLAGLMTDLIGIHAIFGAFVFGLIIPKGGEFSARLIKRIEDFVSGLLLPLYFASSGLKTDVAKIRGVEAWGLLVLLISTACAGKILGTFVGAMLSMIPVRESLALGVLMNTKGLVELIVLNIGKEKKVLNDEMFAILVLMALFTTFMTTPTVMAIYRPSRPNTCSQLEGQSKDKLRVLACINGPGNEHSLVGLIDLLRTTKKSTLKLYIMNLVELTDRSSSITMVQRTRKNGFPIVSRFCHGGAPQDQNATAFEAYSQVGGVTIRHLTAISAISTMHEDICHVAEDKRAAIVILPFHKQWRAVNQRVFEGVRCSVGLLVDRRYDSQLHFEARPDQVPLKKVCVLFFGGVDDHAALEFGGKMAEHHECHVTLTRFIEECCGPMNVDKGDEDAVAEFNRRFNGTTYTEVVIGKLIEDVLAMGQNSEYNLLIVGKGQHPSTIVGQLADHQAENPELGLVGDILASSANAALSSFLVVKNSVSRHAYGATT